MISVSSRVRSWKKYLAATIIITIPPLAFQVHAADINHGKELIKRNLCVACHGANLNEPISPDYPKLAGQYSDYLYYAMRAYQIDTPLFGRNHPVMKAQLQNLSQQDLRDIAAYIESLPGDLAQNRRKKMKSENIDVMPMSR